MLLSFDEYRCLVEQAPMLIWRCGTDAKCDYFNQRWLEFTGRRLEQEMGDGWAEGVHSDDLRRCLDVFRINFAMRQPFLMEYRLRRHDGIYRWLSDSGAPFFDERGVFSGFIGSCVDVTDRVVAQDELKKMKDIEIQSLQKLLPICASCKKIRNDQGFWEQVEEYFGHHSDASFTHGLCPDCMRKLYPGIVLDTAPVRAKRSRV